MLGLGFSLGEQQRGRHHCPELLKMNYLMLLNPQGLGMRYTFGWAWIWILETLCRRTFGHFAMPLIPEIAKFLLMHWIFMCMMSTIQVDIVIWVCQNARRMVHVNPKTGAMQELYKFRSCRGKMWINWFSWSTLKSMDGDLAELSDFKNPSIQWLWASTGEVFWQVVDEGEKILRQKEKEKRKQPSREKLEQMNRRHCQRVIGKHVKPPPEEEDDSNRWASGYIIDNSVCKNCITLVIDADK